MRSNPRVAVILLAICAACSLSGQVSAWQYWCDDPFPLGQMQISRPEITWPVRPAQGTRLTGARMTLNGRSVPAAYDKAKAALCYLPLKALSPGKYSVSCRVVFDQKHQVTKTWQFSIARGAISELPQASDDQRRAHAAANGYRHLLGLPEFQLDPACCAAATAHMRYLKSHPGSKHSEDSRESGFTGATPSDRAAAFGCPSDAYEDIAYRLDPVAGVAGLIDAPYHRIPFTAPGTPLLGVGFANGLLVMNFSRSQGSSSVVYPVDGQRDVPLMWTVQESPDPLRLHKGLVLPVGYVISYHCRRPGVTRISVQDASLTTQDRRSVPFRINTPANDDCLRTDVFLIPEDPLQPNTTYRVGLTVVDNTGSSTSRSWSFTTVSDSHSAPDKDAPAQLLAAAARGDLPAVTSTLARWPAAVDWRDSTGATALHFSAQARTSDVLGYLVSKGSSVNARKEDGVTALMIAAALGRKDNVSCLLRFGADVTASDKRGRTALSIAKEKRHTQIVQMLNSAGKKPANLLQ